MTIEFEKVEALEDGPYAMTKCYSISVANIAYVYLRNVYVGEIRLGQSPADRMHSYRCIVKLPAVRVSRRSCF